MSKIFEGIEPKIVWDYFGEILQHPHPSKKEEKLAAYLVDWAKQNGFACKKDKTGNIVISKPATPGMEKRKAIAIQGHIDMVCEKNSDVQFDFDNDPINAYIDGDWIKAKGTTLGADNGIGVAMGMALMTGKDIVHPAIELLCTVDEETGLTGAIALENNLINAKILINLDSEEDGAFTIGCAGGTNTSGTYQYISSAVPAGCTSYEIALKGLRGGHSGIEIHDGRANALKLLTRVLWEISKKFNLSISSINGGNKHNAIPRESFAVVCIPQAEKDKFTAEIENWNKVLQSEYATKEPNLNLSASSVAIPSKVMAADFQKKVLDSFYAMPHGVIRMSPDIKGLVQTSTNFAVCETRENEIFVLTSQRSSVETEKIDCANMVRTAFELGGAVAKHGDGYPAWQPNMNSPILKLASEIFKKMYGKEPKIEAIHAGLETGLIGEKYPGMDMLSFGPNLVDVHSPDEKIQISSTQRTWALLQEIVKNIPE